MEKKRKSFTIGTSKRQRKASLRAAVSMPKNLILDIAEIPPIKLYNQLSESEKNINITKNIISKSDSITDATPPKSKAIKESAEIENNTTNVVKKSKKRKHHSEIPAKDKNIAMHIKKKKKEKELIEDIHNLKVQLGIEDMLKPDTKDTSVEPSSNKTPIAKLVHNDVNVEDSGEKYPILKDRKLIDRFLKVPLSNNQKGRIRQAIKMTLQGTTTKMFPEIINAKIQAILRSSTDLTDSELRRIRILHNMLKTALEKPEELEEVKPLKKKKNKKRKDEVEKKDADVKKETEPKKVKGPKRYVVFLGNLPLNVNKEKIMDHFRELNEHIVDIRLPKRAEGAKSAIAYVELTNEPSYELALSKHHSMMGTRRIRVLYTTQKNGKVSRSEAKVKSAKLIALQMAGKLIGSAPKGKRRSHRRAIMKKAKAKEAADTE